MDTGINDILSYNSDENEDYYSILGCDELSSKEQITAEYKARVLSCHPDKYPGNDEKAAEFEHIQTAKDILCNDEKRHNYDKWRHSGISIPFRKWCNMRDSVHTSMHWASPKKEYMLEHRDTARDGQGPTSVPITDKADSNQHIIMRSKHPPPGDLSFMRTDGSSMDSSKNKVKWSSDPPSDMLRRFRNYEI